MENGLCCDQHNTHTVLLVQNRVWTHKTPLYYTSVTETLAYTLDYDTLKSTKL